MTYVYVVLIFVAGISIGRWSVQGPRIHIDRTQEVASTSLQKTDALASSVETVSQETGSTIEKNKFTTAESDNNPDRFARTSAKAYDKEVRSLFNQLNGARAKGNIEEQNRLFKEMERLDPRHEKVFEAKVIFLQEDENWKEAHEVLKECVSTVPSSLFCYRRLTNIRSSTVDDKINYGEKCLQIALNDPLCLVELAIAFHSRGDLEKAKKYFESALRLPNTGEGFDKSYVLFQYGLTLEKLKMFPESNRAFQEACRLSEKLACDKLK